MKVPEKIVTRIGSRVKVLNSGACYQPLDYRDAISVISCDSPSLSEDGGEGFIRVIDGSGGVLFSLNIKDGRYSISDEESIIELVENLNGYIKYYTYFGQSCDVDFVGSNRDFEELNKDSECGMYGVIKWAFSGALEFKGSGERIQVLITDNKDIYSRIGEDVDLENVFLIISDRE